MGFMSTSFTPVLPSHWKHVIGEVPIPPDENRTWDEDIFSAEWRHNEDTAPGRGWWIWLDGGKGLSIWQCRLVEPNEPGPDGELLYDHRVLMRGFFETAAEVQAWIDRAVVIAKKAEEDWYNRQNKETENGHD